MKDFVPELNRLQKIAIIGFIVLIFTTALVLGFETGSAEGQCYERIDTCHGVPFSGSCIGVESSEREFEAKEECENIEGIEESCQESAEIITEQNPEVGEEWKEHATYEGLTCKVWDDNYELQIGR